MKNIGFAQRVTVVGNIIDKTTKNEFFNSKRLEVIKEINQNKIEIDRSCFVKTQEEKDELRRVKKEHKIVEAKFKTLL